MHTVHPSSVASRAFDWESMDKIPEDLKWFLQTSVPFLGIATEQGAAPAFYVAVSEEGFAKRGAYWQINVVYEPNALVKDAEVREAYWCAVGERIGLTKDF